MAGWAWERDLKMIVKFSFASIIHRDIWMFLDIERSLRLFTVFELFALNLLAPSLWWYLNHLWLEHRAQEVFQCMVCTFCSESMVVFFSSGTLAAQNWSQSFFLFYSRGCQYQFYRGSQPLQRDKRRGMLCIMLVRWRKASASLDWFNNHWGWKPCRTWMDIAEKVKEAQVYQAKMLIEVTPVWSYSC